MFDLSIKLEDTTFGGVVLLNGTKDIIHVNSKCHVQCTKDNLQQPPLRIGMLELLVDGPL
jgi:hypothetical protein